MHVCMYVWLIGEKGLFNILGEFTVVTIVICVILGSLTGDRLRA